MLSSKQDVRNRVVSIMNLLSRFLENRTLGSEAERETASLIVSALSKAGINAETLEFDATSYIWEKAALLLRDGQCEHRLAALPYAGTAPIEKVFSRILVHEESHRCFEALTEGDGPAIVLTRQKPKPNLLTLMAETGVNAFIHVLQPFGPNRYKQVPLPELANADGVGGIVVEWETALQILRASPKAMLKITSSKSVTKTKGTNVVVNEEALYSEEGAVVVSAHLDSVPGTAGIGDNAVACAILIDLCQTMTREGKASRICFVWSSGEEWGLQGIRNLCDRWRTRQARVRCAFNLDVLGGSLAEEEVKVLNAPADEESSKGLSFLSHHAHTPGGNGEAIALAELGCPVISLYRFGNYMHVPQDTLDKITPYGVAKSLEFVSKIIHEAAG